MPQAPSRSFEIPGHLCKTPKNCGLRPPASVASSRDIEEALFPRSVPVLGTSSCVSGLAEQRQGCFVLAVADMKAVIRTALGTFMLARSLAFQGEGTFELDLLVFALVWS